MFQRLKGSQIAASLPQKPGPAREEAILNLIKEGHALVVWSPIVVDYGDYRATFYVTAEPLMLGDQWDDAFYPGVTASTMQKIADYYNATLLTPKLVDEIWKQAPVRVDPFQGMSGDKAAVARMSDTATFLSHSAIIKKRIASGRDAFKQISFGMQGAVAPIVANIGKYWTVSAYTSNKGKQPGTNTIASENYGFFSTAKGAPPKSVTLMPNVDVVQTPGHRHDNAHSDYSQVVMLVARSVELCVPQAMAGLGSNYNCKDGGSCQTRNGPGRIKCIDIYDLANDPKLAPMLSHQGTINMRLPSIAYQPPAVCALLALSGIGDYSKPAAAFGESICGKPPPAPGPIGRGPSGGGGSPVPAPGGGSPAVPPSVPSGGIPRRTHRGDPEAEVKAWQRYLLSQGYNLQPAGADGDHGSKTETASVAWEAARAGRVPAVNGGGGVATANVGGETGDIPATTLLLVGAVGIVAGVLGMSILKK